MFYKNVMLTFPLSYKNTIFECSLNIQNVQFFQCFKNSFSWLYEFWGNNLIILPTLLERYFWMCSEPYEIVILKKMYTTVQLKWMMYKKIFANVLRLWKTRWINERSIKITGKQMFVHNFKS